MSKSTKRVAKHRFLQNVENSETDEDNIEGN